jgi:hypothetical protein
MGRWRSNASSSWMMPWALLATMAVLLSSCTAGGTPPESAADRAPALPRSRENESGFSALVASGAYGGLHLVGQSEAPTGCSEDGAALEPGCWWGPLGPVAFVSSQALPAAPDRIAAHGSVILGTHTRLGMVSRIDLATRDLWWAPIAVQPTDVALSVDGTSAFVSDAANPTLLVVDPRSLEVVREVPLPAPAYSLGPWRRDLGDPGRTERSGTRPGELRESFCCWGLSEGTTHR